MRDAGWIQLYAEVRVRRRWNCTSRHSASPRSSVSGDGAHGPLRPDSRFRRRRHSDAAPSRRVSAGVPARQVLDPAEPVKHRRDRRTGAFTEVRSVAPQAVALSVSIPLLAAAFSSNRPRLRRSSSAELSHRVRRDDRRRVRLGDGPRAGSRRRDARRGSLIGSVSRRSFRPFSLAVLREALQYAKLRVVLEECLAVGLGGPRLRWRARVALGHRCSTGYTVIAGLGGRTPSPRVAAALVRGRRARRLGESTFST